MIYGVSGFSVFAIEHILENTETTENFHKLIFQGIKTIYLILTTFLRVLYVQKTIYKALLQVINEHLLLLL